MNDEFTTTPTYGQASPAAASADPTPPPVAEAPAEPAAPAATAPDATSEGDKVPTHADGRPAVPTGAMVNGLVAQQDGTLADPGATGAAGIRLPGTEIGGGEIAENIRPTETATPAPNPTGLLERVLASGFAQRIAPLVGRPMGDWGLVGKGDLVRGHVIMLDLESGEKVRFSGGDNRIEEDRVFANVRNFPEAIVSDAALAAIRGA